jgi:antitoxin YefM
MIKRAAELTGELRTYICTRTEIGTSGRSVSHVSYTELRANLAKYMEEVCDTHATLHITRQNARTVVMLSEEEYEGMLETLHLLRSPANAARLLRSVESAEKGALTGRDLIETPPGK